MIENASRKHRGRVVILLLERGVQLFQHPDDLPEIEIRRLEGAQLLQAGF